MIKLLVHATLILPTVLLGTVFSMNVNAEQNRISFTLLNNSARSIVEFYTSKADTYEWGNNILGKDLLNSRDAVDIIIDADPEECISDLRAVFADGTESVKKSVDICYNGTYTYTD